MCRERGAYQSEFEQVSSFWPYTGEETVEENSRDDTLCTELPLVKILLITGRNNERRYSGSKQPYL